MASTITGALIYTIYLSCNRNPTGFNRWVKMTLFQIILVITSNKNNSCATDKILILPSEIAKYNSDAKLSKYYP